MALNDKWHRSNRRPFLRHLVIVLDRGNTLLAIIKLFIEVQ